MKLNIYAILFVFVSLFAACTKDKDNNNNNSGGSSTGVITVDIDGERWIAETGYSSTFQPFGINLIGIHNQNQLTLTLTPYNGVQSYTVDGATKITFIEDGIQYNSLSGQINVTSVTDNAILGNFTGLVVSSVSSVTLNLTNGTFTIPK